MGTPEERQAEREAAQERFAAEQEEFETAAGGATGFAREASRVVTSGVEKAAQSTIGFANFAGDLAKTRLGLVDEDDDDV